MTVPSWDWRQWNRCEAYGLLEFGVMVVVMILTAWVCFSTIFCLALLGASANSIPPRDELLAPGADAASFPGLTQPLAAH